jgi:hypothetical protein
MWDDQVYDDLFSYLQRGNVWQKICNKILLGGGGEKKLDRFRITLRLAVYR